MQNAARSVTFAVLGDAEPKPDPRFPNLRRAIETINALTAEDDIDFVAGIGDLAHRGSTDQYERATALLSELVPPFYTIVGNEELNAPLARYFRYAGEWNDDPECIPDIRYVKRVGSWRLVFASARWGGKRFSSRERRWILDRLHDNPTPGLLFVHNSPPNIFPDATSELSGAFETILAEPTCKVVFSGHSHMNLDAVTWARTDEHGCVHVHVPGIERTKVGGAHHPRFLWCQISGSAFTIKVYDLQRDAFDPDLARHFEVTAE